MDRYIVTRESVRTRDCSNAVWRSKLLAIGSGAPLSAYYYNYYVVLLNLLDKVLYQQIPFTGSSDEFVATDTSKFVVKSDDTIKVVEEKKYRYIAITYKVRASESSNVSVSVFGG